MKRPAIRVLDVSGSAEAIGVSHGRTFADEIRAYAEERIDIVTGGVWSGSPMGRADVLELAAACLPAHEQHSPELYAELCGIAEGASLTPAEAVVVGGFTDFVDTVRAEIGGTRPTEAVEDDCTAFIVPDHRADGTGFFGQTWDMHDTATDHVVLLRVRADDEPAALVFTTVGCLGQLGMNEHGVCIGINNLSATDGRIGVTWPSVVRDALRAASAGAALEAIIGADLAGGHNYLTFDAAGSGFNVEAMPTVRAVTSLGADALVHTNHTLDEGAAAVQEQRPSDVQASSVRRLEVATQLLDRDAVTVDDVMALTRDEEAICQVARPPYHIESSGAAVMRPKTMDFWAVWGLPTHNEYQHVAFTA